MISTLNALISRAFVVGYILPSLILFLGLHLLFPELLLFKQPGPILVGDVDASDVAFAFFSIWLFALVLSVFNVPIYRLLEGYIWPLNKISRLKEKKVQRRQSLVSKYDGLKVKIQDASQSDTVDGKDYYVQAQSVLAVLRTDFPQADADVLPTRLGNIIRAFERYPNVIYGADGVTLWPWVQATMKEDALTLVENAKSNVDLFVNICVLSIFFSFLCIANFFWILLSFVCGDICAQSPICCAFQILVQEYHLFVWAFLGFLLSITAYNLSLSTARSWGRQVRAAFDTNLNNLAEKMGYKVPENFEERRVFWESVSQKILYLDAAAARSIIENNK